MSIKSPSTTKTERGAYAAIVYLDGDLCVAEDNVGNVISEQAKSDNVSDVIQAAADEVEVGRIFVKQVAESYIIKSGVTLPTETSFVSDGAKLDLTNLNTLFITMGSDGTYANTRNTEVSGFYVLGATGNLNTKFIKATNIPRALTIRNINHTNVNNFIEVRGNCFDARLSNINGRHLKGTWMKFTAFDDVCAYLPNNSIVSHCELSNSFGDTSSSVGIEILASPTKSINGIKIKNVWMELMQTLIYNEGRDTRITNCPFLQPNINTGFVIKNIKSGTITDSARKLYVGGCNIRLPIDATGIYSDGDDILIANNHFEGDSSAKEMIKLNSTSYYGIISGNHFEVGSNATIAAINAVNTSYLNITNNFFRCTRSILTGKMAYSIIANNHMWGNDSYTVLKDLDGGNNQILGNNFYDGLYWLNSALLLNSVIHNNIIKSIVNMAPTTGSGCTIRYNEGYITEKRGTSTGTGAQQTVAHGLSATPTIIMVGDIEQNSAPYQSASADGTNIYVTAGNGLDWWWKAEV